jgi:hypothetical protein
MLNRVFFLLSIVAAVSSFGAKVDAQSTIILSGEAGYADIESGNGYKQTVPVYLSMVRSRPAAKGNIPT